MVIFQLARLETSRLGNWFHTARRWSSAQQNFWSKSLGTRVITDRVHWPVSTTGNHHKPSIATIIMVGSWFVIDGGMLPSHQKATRFQTWIQARVSHADYDPHETTVNLITHEDWCWSIMGSFLQHLTVCSFAGWRLVERFFVSAWNHCWCW